MRAPKTTVGAAIVGMVGVVVLGQRTRRLQRRRARIEGTPAAGRLCRGTLTARPHGDWPPVLVLHGALRLAVQHPDLVSAIVGFGPPLYRDRRPRPAAAR